MKRFVAYVLLIAILVSLCACGKKEETAQPAAAATTAPAATQETEATLDPSSPEAMYGHIDQTQPIDGVYKIWNTEGIQFMFQNPGNKYEILCNIDMGGAVLSPMGEFTGSIVSPTFVVSNFTIQGGDETDFGMISVNKGSLSNITFENVTLIPGEKAVNIGGMIGRNEGDILRCTFTGNMDVTSAGADANVGGLIGYNTGSVKNVNMTVNMLVTATNAKNVGGIAGKIQGGTVDYIESYGKIDVEGQGKSVGLFAGDAQDVQMISCLFSGESNTIDGKLFNNFTGNPEDDERAVAVDALWRDNYKEPIPEAELKLRMRAVEEMNAICSIEWKARTDLPHTCYCTLSTCHGTYNADFTYYGMVYNHKGASLRRFQYCLDEEGYIKEWLYETDSFDGYDAYFGNDCSTAILHALWTVSNTADFLRCRYQVPQYYELGGCLKVGDYNAEFTMPSNNYTEVFWEYNDEQTMLEAYACMRPGDMITNNKKEGGHTRMCVEQPVVVRDQDGNVNEGYSYVLMSEQGAPWEDMKTMEASTCKVNWRYTFGALARNFYVPVTIEEFITGEMEPVVCTLTNDAAGKAGLTTGYIKANYYLDSVTLEITDSQGNVVMDKTMFTTTMMRYETGDADQMMRNYRDDYDMAYFATPLQSIQFQIGETYNYTITAHLGTYDDIVLKEDSFVNG